MARTVTIHEAKTHLSKLIAEVEAGGEIVIARGKQPVVRLMSLAPNAEVVGGRGFGALRGQIQDLPDGFFFDPLPEEELKLWEGRGEE